MSLETTRTDTAIGFALAIPAAEIDQAFDAAHRMARKRRPGRAPDPDQLALDLRAELRQRALNAVMAAHDVQPAGTSTFEDTLPEPGQDYVVEGVMPLELPSEHLVAKGLPIDDPGTADPDARRRAASLALLRANPSVEPTHEAFLAKRAALQERGIPEQHLDQMARSTARLDVLIDRVAEAHDLAIPADTVDAMVRAVSERAQVDISRIDREGVRAMLQHDHVLDWVLAEGKLVPA